MENLPDGLSDLERRLSALAPAGVGLDADRLLFDAGRASVKAPSRGSFWPVAAGVLALLSGGLAAAWLSERAEHRALVEQWDRAMLRPVLPPPVPVAEPAASASEETTTAGMPAPDGSVFASRQFLESGLDGLAAAPPGPAPHGPSPADPPALRVRSFGDWPGL